MGFYTLVKLILIILSFSPIAFGGQALIPEKLIPAFESEEYSISADKAAVLSEDGRYLLFSKSEDEIQPIASISKLMTAMVFVDSNPDWESVYTITQADYVLGGRLHLFQGDTLSLEDLFLTSLIASDNGATLALVHASGLSEEEFVYRMNKKAVSLRLLNTSFKDAIGLSEDNLSTAREAALLVLNAYHYPEIERALKMPKYSFETEGGRQKNIESTDYLLFDEASLEFKSLGGKTGYTDIAGYCFAGLFEDEEGRIFAAAVLNSEGKNGRFVEAKSIIERVLQVYQKQDFK